MPMVPNKKESGLQGRKRRKIEQEQMAKLARSINKFLEHTKFNSSITRAS